MDYPRRCSEASRCKNQKQKIYQVKKQKIDANRKGGAEHGTQILILSNRCSPDFQSPIVKQIHLSLTHQFQFEYIYGNRLQLEFHYRRTQENLYLKVPALLFHIQSCPYVHTK